ncbi:MAG: type II toxin-antitoxin system RelE/ParE family toxin [Limisphaerales bacterium]
MKHKFPDSAGIFYKKFAPLSSASSNGRKPGNHLTGEIRRCRTHRFPYGIIYTVENSEVLIVSVMHLHRHPESWRENLQ